MHDVCVIGAGWSGLAAAERLQAAGLDVVVIEKARGPGGRCSTRRQEGFAFDHGAQYFTARGPEFRAVVESWIELGLLAAWTPRMTVFGERPENAGTSPDLRLVGTPGMNAVLKHLSAALACRYACRAETLSRKAWYWSIALQGESAPMKARHLLLTAPPEQAADLLAGQSELAQQVRAVPMNPCWALLLGYEQAFEADFDAAFDNEGPLAWLARNSSKPGRSGETWLLHADPKWSMTHLEQDPHWVSEKLLHAFHVRVPQALGQTPVLVSAHRWRYALAPAPLNRNCLSDDVRSLVVAGDWCAGNRIEGAWNSGRAAAELVLDWAAKASG